MGLENNIKPRFGILFDVDGVLARGTLAIPAAQEMIKHLKDEAGQVKVPLCFVTNALNRDQDKANQISGWLDINVSPDQMIQAQGPLEVFTKYHNKFCLIIGQGKIHDIAKELGFTNFCSIEDIAEHYPLLDMVDHDNRRRVAQHGYQEKEFRRVEAIILMGEPKRWESSLQLVVDLLKTDGKPDHVPSAVPEKHMPVIACNMDLQFMDRACMPRYGHGAYLLCLESLYKKVTGHDLKYTALVGKPSEITMRYAEHCLSREAKQLGITDPLERIYLIGDTPEADIVGANLYQRFVNRLHTRRSNNEITDNRPNSKDPSLYDPELPQSRNCPRSASFLPQSVSKVCSVLVCTGCYKPGEEPGKDSDEKHYRGHRDFPFNSELYKPTHICQDVNQAIHWILRKEKISVE